MRDEEGGKSTNVMSTPIPEDIYRDVADKVNEYLLADTESPYAKLGMTLVSTVAH